MDMVFNVMEEYSGFAVLAIAEIAIDEFVTIIVTIRATRVINIIITVTITKAIEIVIMIILELIQMTLHYSTTQVIQVKSQKSIMVILVSADLAYVFAMFLVDFSKEVIHSVIFHWKMLS